MLLTKFVSLLARLLRYVAVLFAGPALATVSLIVSPDCPSPTQSVAVEVSAPDDLTGQLYVDRAGTTIRLVALRADADECATVAAKYGDVWSLESTDAFDMTLPDRQSGVCPAATKPVYRLYDTYGLPPNHMYTTSKKARDDMVTQAGWKPEGYGQDGVVMCTPN